jgi:hypothetical protein
MGKSVAKPGFGRMNGGTHERRTLGILASHSIRCASQAASSSDLRCCGAREQARFDVPHRWLAEAEQDLETSLRLRRLPKSPHEVTLNCSFSSGTDYG